jgi:hypothetical protein
MTTHLIHLWLIWMQGQPGPHFGLKITCHLYHHHKICTIQV